MYIYNYKYLQQRGDMQNEDRAGTADEARRRHHRRQVSENDRWSVTSTASPSNKRHRDAF